MLQTLQAGRGIAALLVVLFHLNGSIWGQAKYFPHEFTAPLGFGNAGVQFFFVLSGFIIFYAHHRDLGEPGALNGYLFKRVTRIYPAYWVVLLAWIPPFELLHGAGQGATHTALQIVTSIFLLPHPQDPILQVAWTLRHEVMFYALFAFCIANVRLGVMLMIVWQAACVGALVLGLDRFPLSFLLSANNILFLMGIAVAFFTIKCSVRYPRLLLFCGVAAFLATGFAIVLGKLPEARSMHVLMFGTASAIAIAGLAGLELSQRVAVPWVLRHLGDASYAIYLVHFPVLAGTAKLVFLLGLNRHTAEPVLFLIIAAVAVGAGSAFHLLVERPLLNRWRSARKPAFA